MFLNNLIDQRNLEARVTFYELKDELLEIQNHYESLLMSSTRLPHAGSTNPRYLPHGIKLIL